MKLKDKNDNFGENLVYEMYKIWSQYEHNINTNFFMKYSSTLILLKKITIKVHDIRYLIELFQTNLSSHFVDPYSRSILETNLRMG